MPEETILCSGIIERIGFSDAIFKYKTNKDSIELESKILNHKAGLKLVAQYLLDDKIGVINLILCLVRSLLESVNGLPRNPFYSRGSGNKDNILFGKIFPNVLGYSLPEKCRNVKF